ncbi:tyrosine-type recombinase/integrase [Caballeronia sordidicola]|jgi:integrase/recombinase XerD|uniref:Putative integrase/recombinase n=1 Tax=Caballeronia sordidicola TaxID=196367 RepID=A0A242N3Q2_CABSO|nr:tyrosine-type recombinase/integrase [Caballeronia sordidicola]OTP77776.1 putative integrase/recombinase [Caballeronia sordidicola]
MKLIDVITAYVAMQRSLGMRFTAADRLLRQFAREMGDVGMADVGPEAVVTFLQGDGALTATWRLKYNVLSGLYRFAISRGFCATCALPENVPKLPPTQTPYVYSTEELRRLVEATPTLYNYRSRQQDSMFRTLILLLYGSGLRVGEVLRLTMPNVDLIDRVIIVRDTKFFKTRLVPIGPRLSAELAAHIERRRHLPMPLGENSRLFTSYTGHGWPYSQVITLFQRLRRAAHIECPEGELHPPRLHDLRHTAAVHRVLAWYRDGKDVQRLLPQLATYLGHVDIKSTQRYLRMTPELLEEASRRFAQYAQCGDDHE